MAQISPQNARDFRTVVEADWYQKLFPRMRIDSKLNREAETMTTAKGGRKVVSLGGAVTGFGADLLIVDDLMKAADAASETERQRVKDYYEQTLFSRLRTCRVVSWRHARNVIEIEVAAGDRARLAHLRN